MKKLLSLDGGGIRGLMTALILQEIEKTLPNPKGRDLGETNLLRDHFDLVAGTSTGSILAAAIAIGKPLQAVIDLYETRGENIFPPVMERWSSRMLRSFSQGLSHPKYRDRPLGEELKAVLCHADGTPLTLGEVAYPLLIQAFDATRHEPVVFKSKPKSAPEKEDHDLPLWEVVKASCSAPTFFPAHGLRYRDFPKKHALIDGGVFANNPTLIAIAEVLAHGNDADLLCISLGTSEEDVPGLSLKNGREMGAMEWALPLIGIFMGGGSRHVHSLAKRIVTKGNTRSDRYLRFQMMTAKDIPMDEAGPKDIRRMRAVVAEYLGGHPDDEKMRNLHRQRGFDYAGNLKKLRKHFSEG